jgi:hypothetical protein
VVVDGTDLHASTIDKVGAPGIRRRAQTLGAPGVEYRPAGSYAVTVL